MIFDNVGIVAFTPIQNCDENGSVYTFYGKRDSFKFSTKLDHLELFEYAFKDVNELPDLMRSYINTKLDITTLDIRKNQSSENIDKIYSIFESWHPFYRHYADIILMKEIVRCLDEIIGYLIYRDMIKVSSSQYRKILRALIPEQIQTRLGEERFDEIIDSIDRNSLLMEARSILPTPFEQDIYYQDQVRKVLNALDIDNSNTEKVSMNLYHSPCLIHLECGEKHSAVSLNFEVKHIWDVITPELAFMIKANILIRKCRHCGKYFVAATRRIVYCDRVDETGMRCSAAGYQEAFKKKIETDEALQIYNRAYKTHYARLMKGKMTKQEFERWRSQAKEHLESVRKGNITMLYFREWLKV